MGFVGVLCVLAGCTGDYEAVSWEPVDVEIIRTSIEVPTGLVGPDTVESVIAFAQTIGQFIEAVNYGLQATSPGAPAGTVEGELAVMSGALSTGTNVYLKISCPGGDSEHPVVDFSSGHIRVDSSSLTAPEGEFGLPTLNLDGHGLLRFVECDLNAIVFSGTCPFFLDTEDSSIVLRMALSAVSGEVTSAVALDLFVDESGIAFSFVDDIGENVTVTYAETDEGLVLAVTGINGAYSCLVGNEGIVCSDPEGNEVVLGGGGL